MTISRRNMIGYTAAAAALGAAGCSVTDSDTESGAENSTRPEPSAGTSTSPKAIVRTSAGELRVILPKRAGWTEKEWADVIRNFEAKNPDITIVPTFVPRKDLSAKISAALIHDILADPGEGATYDVIQMDGAWTLDFADGDKILDITDRVPDSWKSEMLKGSLEEFTYLGKYYAAPCFPSTKLFYYNTAMLEKVGASARDLKTWDAVMTVAKELKEKGIVKHPIAWSWAKSETLMFDFAQLLGAFGGVLTDDVGQFTFADSKGEATLKFMMATLKNGATNPGSTDFLEDDVTKIMSQGGAAFCLNWQSMFRELNDEKASQVAGKVGVMQTPAGPSGKRPSVSGLMALAVVKRSMNQEAAWEFVEYATSQAVQKPLAKSAMPVWKASYTDPKVVKTTPEVFKAFTQAQGSLIVRPRLDRYRKLSGIIQTEIRRALLGEKSAKDALAEAAKEATKERFD